MIGAKLENVKTRERYARWMLLDLTLERRRELLSEYETQHGSHMVASLKISLKQESLKMRGLDEFQIQQIKNRDDIDSKGALYGSDQ